MVYLKSVAFTFEAYTIYKKLERPLYKHKADECPKRATELTHNMYELEYQSPDSMRINTILLQMDKEQQILYNIIHK